MSLRVSREASRDSKHQGFPYQIEAVEALKGLDYAAVFHEQGLGKTKIAIDLALTWLRDDVVDSVLFVTKKTLVSNWKEEIKAHSFLAPRILGQNRRDNFFALNSPARFYLAHYEVCLSERQRLALFLKTRRVAVVCDEAQKFKNPHGEIAKALFELSTGFARRVILTGTPIANRPYDIWALIFFLDYGASLGTDFESFKSMFDLTNKLPDDETRRAEFEKHLAALFGKISSFAVRETKDTAGISLPTKTVQNVIVEAEDGQASIYRSYRDELRAIVVDQGVPRMDDADDLLKRLLRLVQVASNPRLVDDNYRAAPGKLEVLMSILEKQLGSDTESKAIVWTSFTDNADWLSKELHEWNAIRLHGKMGMDERTRAVSRFKTDSEIRVLVATPGAAKEGLTLTVANVAVFFDRSFSLDDYLQAQDRIHRISQSRPCFIYNLLMRETVDEWVDELLAAKHLAARLGLGDISREKYEEQANYSFARTLRRILAHPSDQVPDDD